MPSLGCNLRAAVPARGNEPAELPPRRLRRMNGGWAVALGLAVIASVGRPLHALGAEVIPHVSLENYEVCLESKLPSPKPLEKSLRSGIRVVARVEPDFLPGFRLTVTRLDAGEIDVEIIQTDTKRDLDFTMSRIKKKHPELSDHAICSHVRISEKKFRAPKDGKVAALLQRLESLQVPVVYERVMFVHPNTYEVWVATGHDENYFSWWGLDPLSPGEKGPNPLAAWVYELAEELGLEQDWKAKHRKRRASSAE